MSNCPTPHISAMPGDFARTVLMPGDPLRSRFIALNYLEGARLVNDVRGVQGYTGTYKGVPVSVMASGMGQPSIGIYSYELFNFYGVDNIIRVGSCGAFSKDLRVKDIILAMGACTNGNYAAQFDLPGTFSPIADFGLLTTAVRCCDAAKVNYKVGNILASDFFYSDLGASEKWAAMGVLGVEMESAALYCNAARAGKHALSICAVSDSPFYSEAISAEEREKSLTQLIEISLETAIAAEN